MRWADKIKESGLAKGVIMGKNILHVCYTNSPMWVIISWMYYGMVFLGLDGYVIKAGYMQFVTII